MIQNETTAYYKGLKEIWLRQAYHCTPLHTTAYYKGLREICSGRHTTAYYKALREIS